MKALFQASDRIQAQSSELISNLRSLIPLPEKPSRWLPMNSPSTIGLSSLSGRAIKRIFQMKLSGPLRLTNLRNPLIITIQRTRLIHSKLTWKSLLSKRSHLILMSCPSPRANLKPSMSCWLRTWEYQTSRLSLSLLSMRLLSSEVIKITNQRSNS